jgi:hypothetical protein
MRLLLILNAHYFSSKGVFTKYVVSVPLPLTYVGPLHSHSYPAPIRSLAVASVTCITQMQQLMSGSKANAGEVRRNTFTLRYEAQNGLIICLFQLCALFINNKLRRQNARNVQGNA